MWGKKRAKSDKGKPIKKYYIKGEEKHYIWVKWKNPFSDKPDIVWSAEPQSNFTTPELKSQIKSKLSDKKIWPFPSAADGRESGYGERTTICKKERYQLWQSTKTSEQGQTWKLLNLKPQKKMMKTTKYKQAEIQPSLKPTILDSIFFVYTAFDVYDNVILSVRYYQTGNSFITIKFTYTM